VPIRDSSFLKVGHRTQWRAKGEGANGATAPALSIQSKVGIQSETEKIKMM